MKRIILIYSLLFVVQYSFGQHILIISEDSVVFGKDTCCTYDKKPDTNYVGYYIYDFSDTIYFTNLNAISECIGNMTAILGNPLRYCQYINFEGPITGYFQIYFKFSKGVVRTFYGNLNNGYLWDGVIINYFSDTLDLKTATIYSTGQVSNGWLSGIHTTYRKNGEIESIDRYIPEIGGPVFGLEYNEKGELIDIYDDTQHFIKILEQERIKENKSDY